MTATFPFTPAFYRVLAAVEQGVVRITRNGALEPTLHSSGPATAMLRPGNSDINKLGDLFKARLIDFSERGMYNTWLGNASITTLGTAVLNGPWRVENERHQLKQRLAEPSVPTPPSTPLVVETEPQDELAAAVQSVQRFVDEWPKRSNVHPDDIYLMQMMDRENDEVVELPLRRSDLLALLNAVKGR